MQSEKKGQVNPRDGEVKALLRFTEVKVPGEVNTDTSSAGPRTCSFFQLSFLLFETGQRDFPQPRRREQAAPGSSRLRVLGYGWEAWRPPEEAERRGLCLVRGGAEFR